MAQLSRSSQTLMQDEVFQNAFEHAAVGMVLSDLDGRCLRAKGYLLKSDHSRLILTALRTVLAGDVFIAPALTEAWARLQLRPAPVDPANLLSIRERQVLQAVASGKPNLEIAGELGISARTVEVHRRNILDKLGFRNVAQLVKFAMEHNLI